MTIAVNGIWTDEHFNQSLHGAPWREELIRLEDVHRAFGPLTVLEGINLRIDEGDRIGVVGHNGAGKTTLLRTISNRDQDMGDITYVCRWIKVGIPDSNSRYSGGSNPR